MGTKKIVFCLGGSGARVAEVATHLCAANMINESDSITFVVADRDKNNGGKKRAERVLGYTSNIADVENEMGLKRSNVNFGNDQSDEINKPQFCKIDLRIKRTGNDKATEPFWDYSRALDDTFNPNQAKAEFNKLAFSEVIKKVGNKDDETIMNALFKKDVQDEKLEYGFLGRPAVGAALFKTMKHAAKWGTPGGGNDVAQVVKEALAGNDDVRVFIIGTIFGGTGASVFSNIARHIRKTAISMGGKNNERLLISGMLLFPYFAVPRDETKKIDSSSFLEKSKVAFKYYARDDSLFKTNDKKDGMFDCLYICGQNNLNYTSENNADGDAGQINHIDFVDLIAAKAMVEFFNNDRATIESEKLLGYLLDDTPAALNKITFANTRGLETPIKTMLAFSTFVLCEYFKLQHNIASGTAKEDRMLQCLYTDKEIKKIVKKSNNPFEDVLKVLTNVMDYCDAFSRFTVDLANNGKDYSGTDANPHEDDYGFFSTANGSFVIDLNNLYTNRENANNDEYLRRADALGDNNELGITSSYIENELLNKFKPSNSSKKDKNHEYKDISDVDRIGDYLHLAYKICEEGLRRKETI